MTESRIENKKERTSDDADAYDLIMRDKERLLDRREPVRFIFSHSACARVGTIRTSFRYALEAERKRRAKRQEVGRGLRLSVDQRGGAWTRTSSRATRFTVSTC